MHRRDFKEVFEFFRSHVPDTSGQSAQEIPGQLQGKIDRFLGQLMTNSEQDAFFREIRLNARSTELLAAAIRANAGLRKPQNRKR